MCFYLVSIYTLYSMRTCHTFGVGYLRNNLYFAVRSHLFSENEKRKKTKGQNINNPEKDLFILIERRET